MLTRKNSQQKNVFVEMEMYTERDIDRMLRAGYVHWLDNELNQHDEMPDWWKFKDTNFLIFLEDTKEIKVIYDEEWGFYQTVVIMKDGTKIYVKI